MAKFIEVHSFYGKGRILINVDSIAYIEGLNSENGASIYLNCSSVSSREKSGIINKIDGPLKNIIVIEKYSKLKSLIEE